VQSPPSFCILVAGMSQFYKEEQLYLSDLNVFFAAMTQNLHGLRDDAEIESLRHLGDYRDESRYGMIDIFSISFCEIRSSSIYCPIETHGVDECRRRAATGSM